jgi:hypothetical protein
MNGHLTWYVARSAGIVSWAMVSASVLWGLALSTKALGRRPRPNWLLDLHRFLGAAALVFTGIHVGSIMLDSYVHFGLVEVLVPLTGSWHPVAVAWGIVAMYLLVAIEITSLLRSNIPKRWWRGVHFASFPLFAVATVHGLTAGTDATNTALRVAMAVVVLAVTMLTVRRIADSAGSGPRADRVPARGADRVPARGADRVPARDADPLPARTLVESSMR